MRNSGMRRPHEVSPEDVARAVAGLTAALEAWQPAIEALKDFFAVFQPAVDAIEVLQPAGARGRSGTRTPRRCPTGEARRSPTETRATQTSESPTGEAPAEEGRGGGATQRRRAAPSPERGDVRRRTASAKAPPRRGLAARPVLQKRPGSFGGPGGPRRHSPRRERRRRGDEGEELPWLVDSRRAPARKRSRGPHGGERWDRAPRRRARSAATVPPSGGGRARRAAAAPAPAHGGPDAAAGGRAAQGGAAAAPRDADEEGQFTELHDKVERKDWPFLREWLELQWEHGEWGAVVALSAVLAPATRGGGLPIHFLAHRRPSGSAMAANPDYWHCCRYLVDAAATAGAINTPNTNEKTPLMAACSNNNEVLALHLLEKGADKTIVRSAFAADRSPCHPPAEPLGLP